MRKIFIIPNVTSRPGGGVGAVATHTRNGVRRVLVATSQDDLDLAPSSWRAIDLETITVSEWIGEHA